MLYKYILLLLQLIHLLHANENDNNKSTNIIYWDSLMPGQLLHNLNQLTAQIDAEPMHAISTTAKLPTQFEAENRADNAVASSEYDYDRAYEDFVRKYFTDASAKAFSAENSGSVEEEDTLTEATQSSKKHCKKVRKKRQTCVKCRNARTGESSETCSYATEYAPQEYAYEKESKYKTTRESSGENEDKEEISAEPNDENEEEEEEVAKLKGKSGSCMRQRERNKVCYTCINSAGKRMKECRKLANTRKRRGNNQDEHKSQKTQRIYKRTVSYSYENNTNNNDANKDNEEPQQAIVREVINEAPRNRKKIILKIFKRKLH